LLSNIASSVNLTAVEGGLVRAILIVLLPLWPAAKVTVLGLALIV